MDDLEFLKQERDKCYRLAKTAEELLKEHTKEKEPELYYFILQTRDIATSRMVDMILEIGKRRGVLVSHGFKDE